jgi:hypothetical protein
MSLDKDFAEYNPKKTKEFLRPSRHFTANSTVTIHVKIAEDKSLLPHDTKEYFKVSFHWWKFQFSIMFSFC